MMTIRECVQIYLTQETFRTVWGDNMRFAQNQGAWDGTPVFGLYDENGDWERETNSISEALDYIGLGHREG